MLTPISIAESMKLFVDTLQRCGKYLLIETEEIIEYMIFEEYFAGAVSFLHENTLNRLIDAGLINRKIYKESLKLRKMTLDLEGTNKWKIEGVRNAREWRAIMKLSDKIKRELGVEEQINIRNA